MKRALLCAVALLLAGAAGAAAEDWWDFYGRGLAATQRSDWANVASQMQRAVALKNEEELAARAKNNIIVYVPHFWLGIARFNLGDTDGALRELRLSESQGVVQRTQYYPQLKAWTSRAENEQQRTIAAQAAPNRKSAEGAINRALGAQVDAMSAGGDRVDSFRSGQKKLQQALELFNRGGNDPKVLDSAADLANQARTSFAGAAEEAKVQKAARAAQQARAAATAPSPPVAVFTTVPTTVTTASPPSDFRVEVIDTTRTAVESAAHAEARVAVQEYRRALDQTVRNEDARLAAYARGARFEADKWARTLDGKVDDRASGQIGQMVQDRQEKLAQKVAASRPVAPPTPLPAPPVSTTIAVEAPPPPAGVSTEKRVVAEAYAAFATGALSQAEGLLNHVLLTQPRNAPALALRGVVRYTRAMLNPADLRLLDGARSDFLVAVAVNPSLSLDPRSFSPKLIAYFHDVRRSAVR
jgi:hypothetical protein